MIKIVSSLCISLLLTSCQSLRESTFTGSVAGAVVGGSLGAVTGDSPGNSNQRAARGAALGALVGGLMGYVDYKNRNQKNVAADLKKLKKANQTLAPHLTKPEVEKVWVPASIKGDKYVEGHWMYVIKKNSKWSP